MQIKLTPYLPQERRNEVTDIDTMVRVVNRVQSRREAQRRHYEMVKKERRMKAANFALDVAIGGAGALLIYSWVTMVIALVN